MLGKIAIALGGVSLATAIANLIISHNREKEMEKQLKENEEQLKKATGVINQAVKDLADETPVDIREEIVNRAIQTAVDREVRNAVDDAVRTVRTYIRTEIDRDVRMEIVAQRDKLIDDVDRKLTEEVERLSKYDIAADVRRKVTDRMDKDLNDIREKYSRKLEQEMKDLTRTYRNRLDLLVDDNDYWVWKLRRA